ncbi:MAG: hypothetical protein ACK4V6_11065, partial [Microthrixaceae bacterium]
TEYVRSEAARFRGELERQLRQAGLTDAQVQSYLETLNATPEAVETAIRVSGEDAARFKVQSLLQLLEGRIPEAVSISVGNAISSGDLEGAARQLSNLAAQNPVMIPLEVDADKAVQQAESDLLRLPPTIDFVKAALGGYTDEQERGIEAFIGLGDAAQEFISKLVGDGQTDKARQFASDLYDQVYDLARQMGATDEGAKELLTTLGLDGWQVEAGITLAGFDRTVFEITTLLSLLDEDLSPEKKREIGLKIAEGDLEGAVAAVKTEVLLLEQDRVRLEIEALTDPATGQVNIWRAFTEANVFPVVPVGANTAAAEKQVSIFRDLAALEPITLTFEAKFGASWNQLTWFLRPGGTAGGMDGDPRTPFRDGGLVTGPGSGRSDSIPAWLSNGEFVIPEMRVRQYGLDFLEGIRTGQLGSKGKSTAGMTLATDPILPQWDVALSDRPEPAGSGMAGGVQITAQYNEVRSAPTPEDLVRGVGSAMWRNGIRR